MRFTGNQGGVMFIVITKTFFEESAKESYLDLSKRSMELFKKQPGLLSIRSHLSHDNSHTATYFEWEKKQDHENCMANSEWAEFNKEFAALMESGQIKFELNTYDILD